MPNRVPDYPWQVVTTDLITDLPPSQGYDSIWVVVDHLTKRVHAAPTTKAIDSLGLARLFRDHVWRHHGLPEEVISDRGPQFASNFTKDLNRLLGIKTKLSTAYHPQTDGQTERVNQIIEHYLWTFVNERQDDWADWLPIAEFSHNNHVHAATRKTPFEADTGRHPRMGSEPRRQVKVEDAEAFGDRMEGIVQETKSALQKAVTDMARFYDAHHSEAPTLKVGDKVWLDAVNIKKIGRAHV
jgi:hypothetical protein